MQCAAIDVVFTSSVNMVALLNLSLRRSAWLTLQPHGVNKCNEKSRMYLKVQYQFSLKNFGIICSLKSNNGCKILDGWKK